MILNSNIKNLAISLLVILMIGGWVSFFNQKNKSSTKDLEKQNKELADSVISIQKTNGRIADDLANANERAADYKAERDSAVITMNKTISNLKNFQYAKAKKVSDVRGLSDASTDSLYTANLRRYSEL